jgi:hypothetical protein
LKGATVPHRFLVAIAAACSIALVLAGCGGGDSSSSGPTTAAGTQTSSGTSACADISNLQAAATELKQLNASNASATDVKQAMFRLAGSAQALASSASQASGQAQTSLKAATNEFVSQLKAAVDQPVSQQLVTVGKALSQFQSSVSQTKAQLKCNK